MAFQRIYLLPAAVFVLVPVSFLITYTIAVLNEHVEAGFPYISDTGSIPPESCIFGQLLNIAALIMVGCVYVKYLEIKNYTKKVAPGSGVSVRVNKIALAFGLISCIGLDLVANFQESNVIVVHMLGAFLCFGAGTVYFIFQTWISYKLPELTSRSMLVVRGTLVGICILTTISTIVTGSLAFLDYQGTAINPNKWKPEDGGWELHIASTISEWILCITYCVIILSFVPDFYDLEFKPPVVIFKKKNDTIEKTTEL